MADLDSRSKRASSVGILLSFVLAPVLPDGTIDQGDRQHVGVSYSGILADAPVVVATPPDDRDDQDAAGNTLTYTSYTDCQDGATLRAPRITFRVAADSMYEGDFNPVVRADPDRWEARSDQQGRGTELGSVHRIRLSTNRAGESWGLKALKIKHTLYGGDGRGKLANTTAHTDKQDGASLLVPALTLSTATDDSRDAAVIHGEPTDQDRFYVRFQNQNPDRMALTHRIQLRSNRAGACWGIRAFLVTFTTEGETPQKAADI